MEAFRMTGSELDLIGAELGDAVRCSDNDFLCDDGATTDDLIAVICVQHCSLPWPVAELRDFSTDDARINAPEGFFTFSFIRKSRMRVSWPSEALQTVPCKILL